MRKLNQKGFTLIELLIVLAIIFVVAVIIGLLIVGVVWWIRSGHNKAQLNPPSAIVSILATQQHLIKHHARRA